DLGRQDLTHPREESLPIGPPQLRFPEDEGAHPAFLIEWWYGNFKLTDSGGKEYAAMVAYFSPGLKIVSMTERESGRFHHEVLGSTPHYAVGALDLRWGGGDRWFRPDPGVSSYQLKSHGDEFGLNLDMESKKPPLLGAGDGLIRWSGGASHYYALSRLHVKGEMRLQSSTVNVEGIGWMDHQWMSSLGTRGWDWYCVQLDNDVDINFWQISNPDESVESQDLVILYADSSVYRTEELTLERTDSWVSPATGKEYGTRWRVREETHGLDLDIQAWCPHQEVRILQDRPESGFAFWEGRTTVSGHLDGEPVRGTGQTEIVRIPWAALDVFR
ncbi:MAG: lipocalin-like domain-containing protein, partial [Dehalococcoidia bacterium]